MRFNLSEIIEVIEDRRTIYPEQYSKRKVHKEIIEKMLNAAKWAPTHKLTQPWRFTVFMNDGLDKLGQFHAEAYKSAAGDDFREKKYTALLERPKMSSAVIAVAMKRDPEERIAVKEEIASVAVAVQNMSLVATAYGIGTYWGTGGMVYSQAMKTFIGLEESDEMIGLIYLGYPNDWPRKTPRKPIEYFTTWIDA